MSKDERRLKRDALNGLDFGDEMGLVRSRLLRLAAETSGTRTLLEETRVMLEMLSVLARLGTLQAKAGVGEVGQLWDWEDEARVGA